jgi:hypothetical protein
MEFVPNAKFVEVAETPPAGHARAAHLGWQVLPGNAGLEDEQDAGQGNSMRNLWASSFAGDFLGR